MNRHYFNYILFFLFPFFFMPAIGHTADTEEMPWGKREYKWRLSLTYPDYRPDDFGNPVSEADQILLKQFMPRIFVAPNGLVPINFYTYYLPQTVVLDLLKNKKVVKKGPDRAFLKSIERKKRFYLDFTGRLMPCDNECRNYSGAGYGRIYRENTPFYVSDNEKVTVPLIILKYTFVFAASGLPGKLPWYKELFAKAGGDVNTWHELDIHGAVHIVLTSDNTPIALILAQHNHFRTYLIGKGLTMPRDGRMTVCFALRSNEPYPCHNGTTKKEYRTIGNPSHIKYLIMGENSPVSSGIDIVFGPNSKAKQIDYSLLFLTDRDPLYVSWIPLGDRKKILFFFSSFYRNGPPGIDLNSWPDLSEYGKIMQFWYFRDKNFDDAQVMGEGIKSFDHVDVESILKHNGRRFYEDVKGRLKGGKREKADG